MKPAPVLAARGAGLVAGLTLAGFTLAGLAVAGDEFSAAGTLDVRWIHASGDTSYLNGGQGVLRFDPQHEDLRIGRAFIAPNLRVSDIVTLHAVLDAYGDHDRNPLDLSEAWAEVRPFPTGAVRWHARIGAFHAPVSLENRAVGWSDVYTITPAAINTWVGEELRTIGAEVGARWLGASRGYLGDVGVVAAVYAWNDPAGALLAERGFALTDRPSTLFGGLGRPPLTFYHEIDRRPGYYAGLTWRHHDRLELRALHYDNRADPGASTGAGGGAWLTRFWSFGARLEPDANWTLIAQYLDGMTAIGPDADAYDQFWMNYHAAYVLASYEWRRERLTARFDQFGTHQRGVIEGAAADESGHAWTVAWTHDLGAKWELAAEWIHVFSRYPPRIEYGVTPGLLATQVQIALRYRFRIAP